MSDKIDKLAAEVINLSLVDMLRLVAMAVENNMDAKMCEPLFMVLENKITKHRVGMVETSIKGLNK